MDNIRLKNYEMDMLNCSLLDYETMRGIDFGINPDMHNVMASKSFNLGFYFSSKKDVIQFFKRKGERIFFQMRYPQEFEMNNIIKYIKKMRK